MGVLVVWIVGLLCCFPATGALPMAGKELQIRPTRTGSRSTVPPPRTPLREPGLVEDCLPHERQSWSYRPCPARSVSGRPRELGRAEGAGQIRERFLRDESANGRDGERSTGCGGGYFAAPATPPWKLVLVEDCPPYGGQSWSCQSCPA